MLNLTILDQAIYTRIIPITTTGEIIPIIHTATTPMGIGPTDGGYDHLIYHLIHISYHAAFALRNSSTFLRISSFQSSTFLVLMPSKSNSSIITKTGAEKTWSRLSSRAGFLSESGDSYFRRPRGPRTAGPTPGSAWPGWPWTSHSDCSLRTASARPAKLPAASTASRTA